MWLTSLVAVAFLLVPLGLGWWSLGRPDGPKSTDSWPSDPQLKYTLEAHGSPDGDLQLSIAGMADDLYVTDWSYDPSRITRYVEGEEKWQIDGADRDAVTVEVVDERVFMRSFDLPGAAELERLDPETGEVMWTITAIDRAISYEVIDDRLYVRLAAPQGDTIDSLFEYDIDTGVQLNRTTGFQYRSTENGPSTDGRFIAIDREARTLGIIDLDFQPVGERVSIEPSGLEFPDLVWSRHDNGWVYYSDRTRAGGIASAVGLSETGEIQFECQTPVEDPAYVEVRDGSTLVVWNTYEAEVLDIDGSECATRWYVQPGDEAFFSITEYPMLATGPGPGDAVDFTLHDQKISVLDWDTGQPIATGEQFAFFNDAGDEWMTTEGQIYVVRKLKSGDSLWQIAMPLDDYQLVESGLIANIHVGPTTSRIDIYGD